jgi:DNA-binding beta-propeller fold protein YncE
MKSRVFASGMLLSSLLAACASRPGGLAGKTTQGGLLVGTSTCHMHSVLTPLRDETLGVSGASIVLAQGSGKSIALIADEDARSIITVDLGAKTELARTQLNATPSQLMMMPDGRVLVLLRDRDQIVSLEAEDIAKPLVTRCSAATGNEPVALAASGTRVVVSAGFGHSVAVLDSTSLATLRSVNVPREPRSIVMSEGIAYVSHAVGSKVSAVDLEKGELSTIDMRGRDMSADSQARVIRREISGLSARPKKSKAVLAHLKNLEEQLPNLSQMAAAQEFGDPESSNQQGSRPSCQGFALTRVMAGRIAAPQVLVDPGNLENNPDGYGDDNSPTETPNVALLDEGTRTVAKSSVAAQQRGRPQVDTRDARPDCLLPRAAAVDVKSETLLVACFGIDSLVAYDAASPDPVATERARWTVGAGPSGIAVDPKAGRAIVFSQFDRVVNIIPLQMQPKDEGSSRPMHAERITLRALPEGERLTPDYALGRILFHAGGDTRIAQDGRACASCHPDGRDDAITWATPDGPRRSIMLAGRLAKSAPYSWEGTRGDLNLHITHTFERLGGTGLRSLEFDALSKYVTTMPAPKALTGDAAEIARGSAIFHSKEAACATCHSGDAVLSDNQNHNVRAATKPIAKRRSTPLHCTSLAAPGRTFTTAATPH